jgi:hypothetical protein
VTFELRQIAKNFKSQLQIAAISKLFELEGLDFRQKTSDIRLAGLSAAVLLLPHSSATLLHMLRSGKHITGIAKSNLIIIVR